MFLHQSFHVQTVEQTAFVETIYFPIYVLDAFYIPCQRTMLNELNLK